MLCTLITDKDNYILSIGHTSADKDYDISKINTEYLEAYKLVNNEIILDETKKEELIIRYAKEKHDAHIEELKQFLKDTDYIMAETFEKVMALNNPVTFITDILKILVEFKTRYAEVITQREEARQEIEKG